MMTSIVMIAALILTVLTLVVVVVVACFFFAFIAEISAQFRRLEFRLSRLESRKVSDS